MIDLKGRAQGSINIDWTLNVYGFLLDANIANQTKTHEVILTNACSRSLHLSSIFVLHVFILALCEAEYPTSCCVCNLQCFCFTQSRLSNKIQIDPTSRWEDDGK